MNLRIGRYGLFGLALLLLVLYPSGGKIAADGTHDLMVVILSPLAQVYEGDTLTLLYIVEDLSANGGLTLAPLTPDEASATTSLGTVSVAPEGLGGSLTYTADKAGHETITLTVTNYLGTATGTVDLEIKPRPNYNLGFVEVAFDSDAAGGGFLEIFSGEGQFANVENTPIQGTGSSDAWFNLWVSNQAFVCVMDPVIQGSSGFEITGMSGLASLVPGSIDPFILDLKFQSMSLNASSINCQGLGDITANFPWPASQGNPDDYQLTGLNFPGEGGVIETTGPKSWGIVWVERIEQ